MPARCAKLGFAGFALTVLIGLAPASAAARGAHLDPSFATDGLFVHSPQNGFSGAGDLVVEPDGSLVTIVFGLEQREDPRDAFGFTPDGRLDPSFGPNGDGTLEIPAGDYGFSRALALPDGKILIGSVGRDVDSPSQPPSVRFTRLLADGSLDPGFGDGGTINTGIETYGGLSFGVGADGRIVTASTAPNPDAGRAVGGAVLIARFHSGGSLDGSFGTDGFVTLVDPAASSTDMGPLVVEPNGGIVVAAGTYEEERFTARTALFRVTADGALDEGFGSAGFSRLPESHYISDLALSPSGRLIGVGEAAVDARGVDFKPQAFRLEPTGALDPSFSGNGIADLPAAGLGGLSSLVLEPDGSILAAGIGNVTPYSQGGVGGEPGSDFLLVRIKRTGRPDRSFARHGVVLTDVGGNTDGASAIGVQPDGRIVLAGSRANWVYRGPTDQQLTLARYNRGNGRIDSDGDGVLDHRDRCITLRGRHRGCPLRARRLSIELREGAFVGRLRSAKHRCVKEAPILLVRRRAGKTKVVGADRRLRRGRYAVDAPAGAGKYFAKVKRDRYRRVGTCAAARSKSIIRPH